MTLPYSGASIKDVRASENTSPYTDYDVDIKQNFDKVEAEFIQVKTLTDAIAASGQVDASDAVNNVPNLLINGRFNLSLNAPRDENATSGIPSISTENAAGDKVVRWADCWFVREDSPDALDVVSLDLGSSPTGAEWDDPLDGVEFRRGTGSALYTGRMYQRLDLHYDLVNMRNKQLNVVAQYTSVTDDEFYIEVDDGVSVTNNQLQTGGPSPAATSGLSRHSHTISDNATKLTVAIVLQAEAPVTTADSLKILQVFARIGVGTLTLPATSPPMQIARDAWVAQQYSRIFEFGEGASDLFILSGSMEDPSTGDEQASFDLPLNPPIINDGINTLLDSFVSVGDTDSRAIGALVTPPDWKLVDLRRPWLNRSNTTGIGDSGYYNLIRCNLSRLGASDFVHPLSGSARSNAGFTAELFGCAVAVIPEP